MLGMSNKRGKRINSHGEQNTTAGNPQITMTPGNTRDVPRVTTNVDDGGPGGSHPSQPLFIDVRDGICFFLTMFRNHSYPLTFLYKNKLIQQVAYTGIAMVSWCFFPC